MNISLNVQKDFNINLQPDSICIDVIGSPYKRDGVVYTNTYYEVRAGNIIISKGNYEIPISFLSPLMTGDLLATQNIINNIVWNGILTGFTPLITSL